MEYGTGVLVGERGQITIEKPIRERLGIRPRDVAVQSIEHGRLVVTFVPGPHRRSLLGALGQPPGGRAAVPPVSEDEAVARGVAEDERASAPRPLPTPEPGEDNTPR